MNARTGPSNNNNDDDDNNDIDDNVVHVCIYWDIYGIYVPGILYKMKNQKRLKNFYESLTRIKLQIICIPIVRPKSEK